MTVTVRHRVVRGKRVRQALWWLVLPLLLGGCGNPPPRPGDDPAVRIDAARASDAQRAAVTAPDPLRIPREAPWLGDPVTVHYRGLPASRALRAIAQGRPLRFAFAPDPDPVVMAPHGARTLGEHLTAICRQADWAYTVTDGVVLVEDIETRAFSLAAQPGISEARVPLRGLRGGDGDGGDSAANAFRLTLDPYAAEVAAMVEGVLGLAGETGGTVAEATAPSAPFGPPGDGFESAGLTAPAQDSGAAAPDPRTGVTVLPSSNLLVVTAKPHRLRAVERMLARYNGAGATTVRLAITLYDVDLSGAEERSLDLKLLRAGGITATLTSPPGGNGEATPASVTLDFNEGNRFDGSKLVYNWLQSQGDTRVAFSDTLEILNNRVASVDATRTRQYVARVSRETEVSGASERQAPEVEFDELRTGLALHVQPTVVDGLITVRLGLSRSTLIGERPYSFDGGNIAGVNFITDDLNRRVSVSLRNGETKLLTSLSSTETAREQRRTPWLPWLGDGVNNRSRSRETVMLISAYIL